MEKIFLVANNYNIDNIHLIADKISQLFGLTIAPTCISTLDAVNSESLITKKYFKELDNQVFFLAFKNNAMLYSLVNNNYNIGITMEDFYNNDIFCLSLDALENVPESRLINSLIIWVDIPTQNITKQDISSANIILEIIENTPYLYFYENVEKIISVVSGYLQGDDETKQHILEENS